MAALESFIEEKIRYAVGEHACDNGLRPNDGYSYPTPLNEMWRHNLVNEIEKFLC